MSDTTFTVGGTATVDSGLGPQRNITLQNLSNVRLTLTNTGTKPHDLAFHCISTGLPAGCPTTSCFPPEADIPALAPGASATATFVTPAVEGPYRFTSDEPGDTTKGPDGGVTGLIGEFTLE